MIMETFEEILVERTASLNVNPIYKLRISADGRVFYFGKAFSASIGNHTWTISPKKISQINELLKSSSVFQFKYDGVEKGWAQDCESYSCFILMNNGRSREFTDYCVFPKTLMSFQLELESIIGLSAYLYSNELTYYMLTEKSPNVKKDFHFLRAKSAEDAVSLVHDSVYSHLSKKEPKWNIAAVGKMQNRFRNDPYIYVSSLKEFSSEKILYLNHSEKIKETDGNLFLFSERNSSYNDVSSDFHLVFAESADKALKLIQKTFPDRKNNLKYRNFAEEKFIPQTDSFENSIIFSRLKSDYIIEEKWKPECSFRCFPVSQ